MSMITPKARARCAASTLQEQLEQLRTLHAVELARLIVHQKHDMMDVALSFEADKEWDKSKTRSAMRLDGAD